MAQRAGFSEPVLDVDRHSRHYADAATLMREIKAIGAHNVHAQRRRGLNRSRCVPADERGL